MKKIFVLFSLSAIFVLVFGLKAQAAGGDLDLSFGAGGKVIAAIPSGGDAYAYDAVLDGFSGKIVVAGEVHSQNLGTTHIAIARFHSNGTLDTTFGAGGWVDQSFGLLHIRARAITRQLNGKLIVAGSVYDQQHQIYSIAVARFLSNGTPDRTFASNGLKVFKMGSGTYEEATDVAVQWDGKIVLTSVFSSQGQDDFGVIRLNSNGSYDSTWGILGLAVVNFGFYDYPYALALQPDGKVVAVGQSTTGVQSNHVWSVARFNSNGWLDSSFGSSGKLTIDLSNGWDWALAVTLQSDGRIVVSGMVNYQNFGLARISSTGGIEFAFVNDFPNYSPEESHSVGVAGNARIISAGFVMTQVNVASFALSCHTDTGLLDASFGTAGRVTTDVDVFWDEVNKILVQTDAKIIAVGWAEGADEQARFALVRYLGCGV